MNINQKKLFKSYLCIILALLMTNSCITNSCITNSPITNLSNTRNTISHQSHSHQSRSHQSQKNFFYNLYEKYRNIPNKISINQVGTLCYTVFKIMGVIVSANTIKNFLACPPLSKEERNFCYLFTALACLLSEDIYNNLKDLYSQHIIVPDITNPENNEKPENNDKNEPILEPSS